MRSSSASGATNPAAGSPTATAIPRRAGAAVFAELIQPGFVGGLVGNPASAALLALAAALQLAGFAAIRRLSRVAEIG